MTTRESLKNELVQLLQKRQPKHQDLTDSDRQTISFYIRFIVFKILIYVQLAECKYFRAGESSS